MNFQFFLEKLMASKAFDNFMAENKEAYPCGGFFIVDLVGSDNKQHFDYYNPEVKKMFSIKLEDGIQVIPVEMIDPRVPGKVKMNYDFDFNDIIKMIQEEMKKQEITNKIQKVILSLQELEGRDYLVGTVFITGMGMAKVNIDISEMKIIGFEKKSFFDMMRK